MDLVELLMVKIVYFLFFDLELTKQRRFSKNFESFSEWD